MLNESKIKISLVKTLRSEMSWVVVLRHEDQYSVGIPDMSASTTTQTVWLEIKVVEREKHAFKKRALQHEILKRLGGYYVVYDLETTRPSCCPQPPRADRPRSGRARRPAGF